MYRPLGLDSCFLRAISGHASDSGALLGKDQYRLVCITPQVQQQIAQLCFPQAFQDSMIAECKPRHPRMLTLHLPQILQRSLEALPAAVVAWPQFATHTML